jgi:para-nitrobenzyl esterase
MILARLDAEYSKCLHRIHIRLIGSRDDAAEKRFAGSGADNWLYDFRWKSPQDGLSAHCYELPFVWDLLDAEGVSRSLGSTPPQYLADEMHSRWVEFVAKGDPGWSRISTTSQTALVFHDEVASGDSYELERRLRGLT